MPHEITFYPQHHLLYERGFGIIPLDEVAEVYQTNIETLAQAKEPIHILMDLRETEQIQASLIELRKVMQPIDSPNLRWMVLVIEGNPLLQFLSSVLIQIVRRNTRHRLFKTMEEAVAFLQEMDTSIDLKAWVRNLEKQY